MKKLMILNSIGSLIMGEKDGDFEKEFYKNFQEFVREKQAENK